MNKNSKEIKLPFGLNKNNKLVHISQVESGLKCCCFCPSCRSPLIAVKGKEKEHHFRHNCDCQCTSGLESAIHMAAKQIIKEKMYITLPEYVVTLSGEDSRRIEHRVQKTIIGTDGKVIHFEAVQEEASIYGMRADILAKRGNKSLVIEIFYRHRVDDHKRKKLVEADVSAVEINVSDLKTEDIKNWEHFWLYINDPQHVRWLHNARSQTHYPDLERELANKIHRYEELYKHEEINEQKRIENEKERLLHAWEEVKIISSKKHREKLKQKAETHSFWKTNAQHLPFSCNKLPDFVNAYVHNGDWIYGCYRSIWQSAFYLNFVCKDGNMFFVQEADDWLRNKGGCKVPACVGILAINRKKHPQLVPDWTSRLSSWETLRSYCNHLCELGMLKFISRDSPSPGSCIFEVISKTQKKTLFL